MFLVNSRLGLFTATPSRGRLFSRSYESNLPSSLTTLLPLVLGFSPHLPVSVCGTGALVYTRAFLALKHRRLPYCKFSPLRPGLPTPGSCYLQVSLWFKCQRLRNFHRMCIGYAFRPRLSSRLTLGGRTFPKKPQIFDHYDSHIILATYSGILTPVQSTRASAHASPRTGRSPTQYKYCPSFGSILSPAISSAQSHSTSELLRTL